MAQHGSFCLDFLSAGGTQRLQLLPLPQAVSTKGISLAAFSSAGSSCRCCPGEVRACLAAVAAAHALSVRVCLGNKRHGQAKRGLFRHLYSALLQELFWTVALCLQIRGNPARRV